MKLTIIVDDSTVYINGISRILDLSSCGIPKNIHALQWYETEGEVEFKGRPKPQNELLTELPVWANACVDVYKAYVPPAPPVIPASAQPATTGTQTA